MGNCSFKQDDLEQSSTHTQISKHNFSFHHVIGRGGFGKVWKVEYRKNNQVYAMKEMSKAKIINKRSVNSVINERKLLSKLKHPFLVNINYAFQDRENLYLVSDLLTGGDLRYHIGKMRRFNEEQTKFMLACMILGLEYMHIQGVIHRDIKPENIVMEESGYVRITDMGIAKIWRAENSCDTSGTPGYMAPEVMCRQNHTYAVDYFAVGVIGYEFMLGRRPYVGKTRNDIRNMMFARQVQIKRHELPEGWSLEAADFINKCLQRKPGNRIGLNGPTEVKQHIWLRNFDWQALLDKKIDAPYKPKTGVDNFDKVQANAVPERDQLTPEEQAAQYKMLQRPSIQALFDGYHFEPMGEGQLIIPPAPIKAPQTEKISRRRTDMLNDPGTGISTKQSIQNHWDNRTLEGGNSKFESVVTTKTATVNNSVIISSSLNQSIVGSSAAPVDQHQSMLVEEKERRKRRAFSIKANSLIPDRFLRKRGGSVSKERSESLNKSMEGGGKSIPQAAPVSVKNANNRSALGNFFSRSKRN